MRIIRSVNFGLIFYQLNHSLLKEKIWFYSFESFLYRAVADFALVKQTYGAGNCHLLQINSKRAGQTADNADGTTDMPDPWRLYVKQSIMSNPSAAQTVSQKDSLNSDSVYSSSELIDQEGNSQSNIYRLFQTVIAFVF